MIRRNNRSKTIHPAVLMKMSEETKEYLPVIVYSNATCSHIRQHILDAGGKIKYELPFMDAIAAEMPKKSINEISSHHMIQYINDDAKVFKTMDIASLAVDSVLVHEAGYTGKGIGVAVIDTGVYPHDDLTKPSNRIVAFKDFVNNRTRPYDDDGHGTHVAGIIAGNGYSNERYKGIAPEANIVGIKVLDEEGSGNTSDILAALQWVIDNKQSYNIRVISMSLGSTANASYRKDALAKGVAAAVDNGLTVVVSAGNSGPSARSITSPGISPSVITVGASNDNRTAPIDDDFVADFSSRGPTLDGIAKPDIVAPGVDIMSLSHKGPASYVSHSGTSMAAPIVAGGAALLYEKEPHLSPAQVKARMINSALPIERNRYSQGRGTLSIRKALGLENLAMPESDHSNLYKRPFPRRRRRF